MGRDDGSRSSGRDTSRDHHHHRNREEKDTTKRGSHAAKESSSSRNPRRGNDVDTIKDSHHLDSSERHKKRDVETEFRDNSRHDKVRVRDERRRKHHSKDGHSHREADSKNKKHRRSQEEEDRIQRRRRDSDKDHKRKKRKHREDDDDERRKSRKKRKEGRKEKGKLKSGSLDDTSSKGTKPDKANLASLGNVVGKAPDELLDPENDYFAYHQHLWVYLFREEGLAFNDLTSEEARQAFERFTERYNAGDLEEAYYSPSGFPQRALDECKTTRHSWSFKTSETERQGLEVLQRGVRKQTDFEKSADELIEEKRNPATENDRRNSDQPRKSTGEGTSDNIFEKLGLSGIKAGQKITIAPRHDS